MGSNPTAVVVDGGAMAAWGRGRVFSRPGTILHRIPYYEVSPGWRLQGISIPLHPRALPGQTGRRFLRWRGAVPLGLPVYLSRRGSAQMA